MTEEQEDRISHEAMTKFLAASAKFCNDISPIHEHRTAEVIRCLGIACMGAMGNAFMSAAKDGENIPPEILANMMRKVMGFVIEKYIEGYLAQRKAKAMLEEIQRRASGNH